MAIHTSFVSFTAIGVQIVSSGTTGRVALPVTASGAPPKFVRIQSNQPAYIRFGDATVVATINDFYLSPNNPELVVTAGMGYMACLQDTAAAKINITPLEA